MTAAVIALAVLLGIVAIAGILLALAAGAVGCRTWALRLTSQIRDRP